MKRNKLINPIEYLDKNNIPNSKESNDINQNNYSSCNKKESMETDDSLDFYRLYETTVKTKIYQDRLKHHLYTQIFITMAEIIDTDEEGDSEFTDKMAKELKNLFIESDTTSFYQGQYFIFKGQPGPEDNYEKGLSYGRSKLNPKNENHSNAAIILFIIFCEMQLFLLEHEHMLDKPKDKDIDDFIKESEELDNIISEYDSSLLNIMYYANDKEYYCKLD